MKAEEFHQVKADNALRRIANGEMPSEFCAQGNPNIPTYAVSIELWASQDANYAERLIEAKRIGAQVMLADCIRIAGDRAFRPDERKLMIDARKYVAALWNVECNPKQIVEQKTTHMQATAKADFIETCTLFRNMTERQAEAEWLRVSGLATIQ